MRVSMLAVFHGLVLSVVAAPSTKHVIHEKRSTLPPGWELVGELDGSTVLPMKVALSQSNLDKGEDFLMKVSHPDSPSFGQHWSPRQIAETFAPSRESTESVLKWLKSAGITPERISRSQSMGWLNFEATVAEAENLLKTKYNLFRHVAGKPHVGCSEYHIPEHIAHHVDFITPTVHFDSKIPQSQDDWARKHKRAATTTAAAGTPVKTDAALGIGKCFQFLSTSQVTLWVSAVMQA